MANLSPYIGSVFGIKVQLHWTFVALLVFAALMSLLYVPSASLFLMIVLLFVCVFVHELSHSLVARGNGIAIKKIMLLPIGGVSVMDETKGVPPKAEFRIAIAGPIMSIFLGLIFGMAVIYYPPGLVHELLQFLFLINILLGVFNILPAFPLDGGRVLRSYLQERRSQLAATKLAYKVSNMFLWLFIIGTIIYAALIPNYTFLQREFLVFWDIIIVIFLYDGAKAELWSAYVREYASGLKVKDAVITNYIAVGANARISKIYQMVIEKHTNLILVRDGKKVRVVTGLSGSRALPKHSGLRQISREIPIVDQNRKLSEAISLMGAENFGLAAVTAHGRLVGILLAQHAESIISLRMSRAEHKGQSKAAEG